ncbi:hypothetical protein [Nocardia xishanensis]|uniref:hypothetical protein n=1 Tax=Nocardia xishanensis TaxID=238964 RepID=UPI00082C9CAC|nr:hypothetical protein [Nocardia xishanensis]
MSDNTIVPLSREETLTLLLDGLPDYLASVHRIIEFARGMATAVGGEPLTVLEHLLAEHERPDRLVRLSHRALKTPPGTDTGGADAR